MVVVVVVMVVVVVVVHYKRITSTPSQLSVANMVCDSLPAPLCVDLEVVLEMLKVFPEPPVQVTQNYTTPYRCNSGHNFSFC